MSNKIDWAMFFGNFQSLMIGVGVVIGGIWTFYIYNDLQEDKKSEYEIQKLTKELEGTLSVNINVDVRQSEQKINNRYGIFVDITYKNESSRVVELNYWKNEELQIYKINYTDSAGLDYQHITSVFTEHSVDSVYDIQIIHPLLPGRMLPTYMSGKYYDYNYYRISSFYGMFYSPGLVYSRFGKNFPKVRYIGRYYKYTNSILDLSLLPFAQQTEHYFFTVPEMGIYWAKMNIPIDDSTVVLMEKQQLSPISTLPQDQQELLLPNSKRSKDFQRYWSISKYFEVL